MKIFWKILTPVIVIIISIFISNSITNAVASEISEAEKASIKALLVFIFFMLYVLFVLIKFIITKTTQLNDRKFEQKQKDYKGGVIKRFPPLLHTGGLNIPINIKVEAALKDDSLMIVGGGKEYTLKFDKIVNVDSHVNLDINEFHRSSTLKGVTGAMLFGVPGAIIGSAATNRVVRSKATSFAVISFVMNNNEIASIILSDIIENSRYAKQLAEILKTKITVPTNQKINL